MKQLCKKLLILTISLQLGLPSSLYAQQAATVIKEPPRYKPMLVVDGILVPDEEMIHLPQYRTHMSRAFAEQPQVRLVSYDKILEWKKKFTPDDENVHESYLVKARKSLAKGKKKYQELDFDEAEEALEDAKKEFIVNLSHLRANRDLLESYLYLGMTYIALAKSAKAEVKKKELTILAEKEFEKVVMLDPERELASHSYSPRVIEIYGKVKQKLVANNRVTVKIGANVPQARVFINGKFIGPTPQNIRLLPGDYYVLVERKGTKSWSQLMKFKNQIEHVTANLKTTSENADWNGMFQIHEGADQETADMEELQNMSKTVGGEMIFLANLEKLNNDWRLLGQLYDPRTNEFSQTALINIGPIDDFEPAAYDMAQALAAMIRNDGYLISSTHGEMNAYDPLKVAEGQAPQQMQEHEAPKAKLYKQWWFWLGVAALAGGGYYGVQKFGGASGSSININNDGNF
jgi:hypothetical protein